MTQQPPPARRQGLWTPDETAEFLNVKPSRLQRWRTDGSGPAYVKYGRVIRYVPGQVIQWTQQQTITPGD